MSAAGLLGIFLFLASSTALLHCAMFCYLLFRGWFYNWGSSIRPFIAADGCLVRLVVVPRDVVVEYRTVSVPVEGPFQLKRTCGNGLGNSHAGETLATEIRFSGSRYQITEFLGDNRALAFDVVGGESVELYMPPCAGWPIQAAAMDCVSCHETCG